MNEFRNRANEEAHVAWEANAEFWDERMGDGNDFFHVLQWPAILRLLNPQKGQKILDIATGNGITARRLAETGAEVTAFDFSEMLIRRARERSVSKAIRFKVVDATDEVSLLKLGKASYDSALCNMALFDMADIRPLFKVLPTLLKPHGVFVYTLTHPAFNNTSAVKMAEELDDSGVIRTDYSIKISKYMTCTQAKGLAMRDQPHPQPYFDRPLEYYFNLGFQNGFVLDGFEERAFPASHPQKNPLGWGGAFSEIPPVLAARLLLMG